MPIDFTDRMRPAGGTSNIDFSSRMVPAGPGSSSFEPLNEQGVTDLERTLINTSAPDMRSAAKWLQGRGYEAEAMEDEDNVAVRAKDGRWKKVEPSGIWNSITSGDIVKDLGGDALDEYAEGAAMAKGAAVGGAAGAPAGGIGAIPGALAGAGIGAGLARTARHGVGLAAGFEDSLGSAAADIGESTVLGALGEGAGMAVGKLGKGLLRKWRGSGGPAEEALSASGLSAIKAGEREMAQLGDLDPLARDLAESVGGTGYPSRLKPGPITVEGVPASSRLWAWEKPVKSLEGAADDYAGNARWYTENVRPLERQAKFTKPLNEKYGPKAFEMSRDELSSQLDGKGESFVRQVADAAGIKTDGGRSIFEVTDEIYDNSAKVINALKDKRFSATRYIQDVSKERGHGAVAEAVFIESSDDGLRRMLFAARPPPWSGTIDSAVVREWLGSGSLKDARETVLDVVIDNLRRKKARGAKAPWWERMTRERQMGRSFNLGTKKSPRRVAFGAMTLNDLVIAVRKAQPGSSWFSGMGYNPKLYGVIPVWDIEKTAWRSINLDGLLGIRSPGKQWMDYRGVAGGGGVARKVGGVLNRVGQAMNVPGEKLGSMSTNRYGPIGQAIGGVATLPGDIVQRLGGALFRDNGTLLSRVLRGPMPSPVEKELRGVMLRLRRGGPRAARAALFVALKENEELRDYLESFDLGSAPPTGVDRS